MTSAPPDELAGRKLSPLVGRTISGRFAHEAMMASATRGPPNASPASQPTTIDTDASSGDDLAGRLAAAVMLARIDSAPEVSFHLLDTDDAGDLVRALELVCCAAFNRIRILRPGWPPWSVTIG
jgi:hypothetical protein